MTDVDALLADAQRAEMPVDLYLGPPEWPVRLAALKADDPAREEMGRRMRERTLTTRVRAIPHREWVRAVAAHPPRENNANDRKFQFHVDDFFAEVVPLCLPDLTRGQYDKLDAVVSEGEWDKLCSRVLVVNTGTVDVPFSPADSSTSPTSDGT